jgi:hypothetical protein
MSPSRLSRALALLGASGALLVAACSGARPYRVEVALPAGVTSSHVEVRVLSACGTNDVLAQSSVDRGAASMALGSLPAGTYGVEALVFDADCRVVAEACVMVTASGAGGTVRVDAVALDRLRDCARDEQCACMPGDAGLPDAGPPVDAPCTDCDMDGRCENLLTDRANCGRCGNDCAMGERCQEGSCR